VATAPKVGAGVYAGQLLRTTGPSFSATPFDPAKVSSTVVGSATLTFANGNAATLAYTLHGVFQTKAITRQLFAPPAGTVCRNAPDAPTGIKVVVAGDIAQCLGADAARSGAARTAALITPQDDIVLTAGDNAYESGSPTEFASCFHPTWGAFKDRIYPTPGNHDYYTPYAEGYYNYFGARAGPNRRGYYSFDVGGWHIISLNSVVDITPESEQHRWLVADLAKSRDSLCTLAVMHYPAFNSGANHGSILAMRPVFETLQAAGVELVLSGHEHVYERFAPQRADGTPDPARGLRQFVIGTGGASLYEFGTPMNNSEFRYNANWGVLRLTLGEGSYGWNFVSVDGARIIDAGTANCHR
jgi:3',5'-cyclic AMP phosphodiesterase CpdA